MCLFGVLVLSLTPDDPVRQESYIQETTGPKAFFAECQNDQVRPLVQRLALHFQTGHIAERFDARLDANGRWLDVLCYYRYSIIHQLPK